MTPGRPLDSIITQNFTKLKKLDNKTNHYELECKHCLAKIVNRDNNHIKHISDLKKCPNVSADIRQQALIYLAGKNVNNAIAISGPVTEDEPTSSGKHQGQASGSEVIIPKKRPRTTLAGMVDYPLTDALKQHADVKLFRCELCLN